MSNVWNITKLSLFTYYFRCEGSACLHKHKTGIQAATDDIWKTSLRLFCFSCMSQPWQAQCTRVWRGEVILQSAVSSAVEGVCHTQLKSNPKSLLNYMIIIFCFIAKLLQTDVLGNGKKIASASKRVFFFNCNKKWFYLKLGQTITVMW